jgi:Flp pilus assembly protein TadD
MIWSMPQNFRSWLAGAIALLASSACVSPPGRDAAAAARADLAAGRHDEAAREIERAVREDPSDVALRREAARILAKAGYDEPAVEQLEAALQLAPANPEISIQLGQLEQSRSNLPDAYVAFRRAADLAPDDIRAISGLALSAEALGFEAEARDAYARWAELEREQGKSD